jgi:hypothetical protein
MSVRVMMVMHLRNQARVHGADYSTADTSKQIAELTCTGVWRKIYPG